MTDVTRFKNSILDKQEKCKKENKEFILTEQDEKKMSEALSYLDEVFKKKSELKDSLQEKIKEVNKDFETIRDIKTIVESFNNISKAVESNENAVESNENAVESNENTENTENNQHHNNDDDDDDEDNSNQW